MLSISFILCSTNFGEPRIDSYTSTIQIYGWKVSLYLDIKKLVNYRLTIRKQAPIITAFILTSRSIGNWIPKLSASVNASLTNPVHCLEILPTTSSFDFTWNKTRCQSASFNIRISHALLKLHKNFNGICLFVHVTALDKFVYVRSQQLLLF